MVAQRLLLDFPKMTAARRPPIAGQGVDCPAETQLPFAATFVDDTIWYQVIQIKTSRLPTGHPAPDPASLHAGPGCCMLQGQDTDQIQCQHSFRYPYHCPSLVGWSAFIVQA
jgi:hypothetical protein